MIKAVMVYEKKFFDQYKKTDNVVVIKNGVSDELTNYKNVKASPFIVFNPLKPNHYSSW